MSDNLVKFGRLPRTYRPDIPHDSALAMGMALPPPPPSADWTKGVDPNWSVMLNDQLGDCTCAAAYHAMQLWSAHGRTHELTEPDAKVEEMYREFCGYDPADPSTDRGGVEQDVLAKWFNRGVPITEGPNGRSKLRAFIEVDPRNHGDVKRVIANCGCIYIGFLVPDYLMSGPIPMLWNYEGQSARIIGGHAVIATGYNYDHLAIVSWGSGNYRMSWDFWDRFVDEAYALAHPWFIDATGRTPLGMSLDQLKAAMSGMRRAR
jgi:hypothetical protein